MRRSFKGKGLTARSTGMAGVAVELTSGHPRLDYVSKITKIILKIISQDRWTVGSSDFLS